MEHRQLRAIDAVDLRARLVVDNMTVELKPLQAANRIQYGPGFVPTKVEI